MLKWKFDHIPANATFLSLNTLCFFSVNKYHFL